MSLNKRYVASVLGIGFGFFLANAALAANPQSFIYQGQLATNNGAALSGLINFRLQILAPNGCLLYEERQTGLDLSASGGHFSLQVGSAVASAKRTVNDPGLAMTAIFSNANAAIRGAGTNCANGYTPVAGDTRALRVIIEDDLGVIDTLAPDQTIASAPFAVSAETLQGKQPGDFIQSTIANMQSILENLASGTSTLYLKADGSNAAPLNINNQRITNLATPVNGTDAASKNYCDANLGGQSIDTTNLTAGSVLSWNTILNKWTAAPMTDAGVQSHARAAHPACSAGQASSWNGSSWSCVSVSGGGGGGNATQYSTSQAVVLTNASAKLIGANFPDGGSITMPDATTLTTGGPLFTIFNQSGANGFNLPVLDNAGNFIGAIAPGNSSGVFLFNNASAGGSWAIDGGAANNTSGIEAAALDDTGLSGQNVGAWAPVGAGAILATHSTVSGGTTTYYGRVVSFDPVTKAVAWGSSVSLATSSSGGSTYLVPLSPTSAVFMHYDGGSYQGVALTISGSSISAGTGVTLANHCSNSKALDATRFVCFDNSSYSSISFTVFSVSAGSIAQVTGGSVTNPSGANFNSPFEPVLLGGKIVVPTCQSVYNAGTSIYEATQIAMVIDPADIATNSVVSLTSPSPNGCGYEMGYSSWFVSSRFLPIDANNAWYAFNNNGNNTALKLTYSGALSNTGTVTSLPGTRFFKAGGSYYLTQADMLNSRSLVTNASTLALDPKARTYDCNSGVRAAANRCVYLDHPGTPTKARLIFQVGY